MMPKSVPLDTTTEYPLGEGTKRLRWGQTTELVGYSERFRDPFGLFDHEQDFEAVLKFDAFSGFFNTEKRWPDGVRIETLEDESVIMHAKTRSKKGIKKFIFSHGSEVEVISPQWLREEIKDSLEKELKLYK